jgi:hypothetical protein
MKKFVFIAKIVSPSCINSKAAACVIYKNLNGDLLPRERCKGQDDALVMAEVALAAQDLDMMHGL